MVKPGKIIVVDPVSGDGAKKDGMEPPVILVVECNPERKENLKEEDFDSDCDYETDSDDDEESEAASQADIINAKGCDDGSLKQKRSCFKKYRGMMLAVLSSLIFSVTALLVKKLKDYDPFNLALYKFQGALLPAVILLMQKIYFGKKGKKVVENVWPLTQKEKLKNIGLVLLRSFLTCNALLLHIFSLKYLPMGDALTISAASPLFVSILAKVFLGEKCGYSTIIASVLSLVGVVAIAKPPLITGSQEFSQDTLIGTGLAFGCTIVTAISFITLRHIRRVHYSVTTLMYGAWGSLENLVIVLIVPGLIIPKTSEEIYLLLGMAGLTLLGQFAIILAMKSEQAGPVALVRTFDVLFAFLLEIGVLGKLPDIWSLAGAMVIVLAVVFVGLRKWIRSFPRSHPLRKKLRYLSC